MIELTLTREAIALLGANMESHIPASILRAGLEIYKDQNITHIWKDQFNIIHAIVRTPGSDMKLQIDLDFFFASECQCGQRFCPHMAAVFFMLFSVHEDPVQWLDDVQESEKMPNSNNYPDRIAELIPVESPHLNPESWDNLLDRELNVLYRRQTDRFRIDIFYYTAYKKLIAFAEQLPSELKTFFRLYCAIKLLLHAEQHFTMAEEYPLPYYHKVTADLNEHFIERIRDGVLQLGGSSASVEARPYCEAILTLLQRNLPIMGKQAFHWIEIHRLLWSQLLLVPEWLEKENTRLTALLETIESSTFTEATSQVALMAAHLDWLLGRDEEAMIKLNRPHLNASELVVSYLDTHSKTESWHRLGRWLQYALPLLRRAPIDAFARALLIWRKYAKHTGSDASYRHALSELLPRSYPYYTEYLIQTKRIEEWVQFHLLNGIVPSKMDRTQLKQVEQQYPNLMIPVYHHAIERQLALRNRAAYRETVKLLKRLREIYVLSEETALYKTFLTALTVRYQRLHAFMEELEKGKLLE